MTRLLKGFSLAAVAVVLLVLGLSAGQSSAAGVRTLQPLFDDDSVAVPSLERVTIVRPPFQPPGPPPVRPPVRSPVRP
jgi:hypothetical protein